MIASWSNFFRLGALDRGAPNRVLNIVADNHALAWLDQCGGDDRRSVSYCRPAASVFIFLVSHCCRDVWQRMESLSTRETSRERGAQKGKQTTRTVIFPFGFWAASSFFFNFSFRIRHSSPRTPSSPTDINVHLHPHPPTHTPILSSAIIHIPHPTHAKKNDQRSEAPNAMVVRAAAAPPG